MKLSMISSSMSRSAGGVFEAMRQLAFALRDQPNTEISILSGQDEDSLADLPAWGDIRVRLNPVRGPKAFGWQPGLLSALDHELPDVVHLNGLWMYPSLAASVWSSRMHRPRIVSPHGMLDPWALSHSAGKKRLALWAYEARNLHGATVLHALNRAEHDAMRAFGLTNPVAILPNGIEPSICCGDHGLPPWAGKVPKGSRILLFLGRLHPKKGLPALLQAMALAPRNVLSDWHLVVVGWDQIGHRVELERLATEIGISGQVHFTGPLFGAEKYAALNAADAFILPSHSEGLPMSVLEAWAFGLPVLMTDACNLPEGFARGGAMRIDINPTQLADQLVSLASLSENALVSMGEAGRRLVQESFSWNHVAARFRAVCNWMLEGGAVPPEIEMQQ